MSVFTSSHFASVSASGTDWRDTSKAVLEQLDDIQSGDNVFNFGFIYISDHLADDAVSILNLFKSVLKIDDWVGSIGMGVIGCQASYIDKPAISAMLCQFPKDSFCVFPSDGAESADENTIAQGAVRDWLIKNMPVLSVVHGDPAAEEDPRQTLAALEQTTNAFYVGGLSSSRSHHYQIANSVFENALSGVFFSDAVPVSTTVSQGCRPVGGYHIVTKADEATILTLDDRRALDVLQEDLKAVIHGKHEGDEPPFIENLKFIESSTHVPEEFKTLFRGQIHVALPLSVSDQNDFLVRNITGIDVDEGSVTISEDISTGDSALFVQRDESSISSELSQSLVALHKRVMAERGCFEPKGALYISCVARGFNPPKSDDNKELNLIKNIIGDVPMTGFYAGGEINNARLYGYTGILTLFF